MPASGMEDRAIPPSTILMKPIPLHSIGTSSHITNINNPLDTRPHTTIYKEYHQPPGAPMRRISDAQLSVTFKPLILAVFTGVRMNMNRAQRGLLNIAEPEDFLAYLGQVMHDSSVMPEDLLDKLDSIIEATQLSGEHIERSRVMYRLIIGDTFPASELEALGLMKSARLLNSIRSELANKTETINALRIENEQLRAEVNASTDQSVETPREDDQDVLPIAEADAVKAAPVTAMDPMLAAALGLSSPASIG